MHWLAAVVLVSGVVAIVMAFCLVAIVTTPKERRADRAADLLHEILITIRRSARHRQ